MNFIPCSVCGNLEYKLMIVQLVTKFSGFHKNLKFIAVFKTVNHWALLRAR
jgi:hypothetical protein